MARGMSGSVASANGVRGARNAWSRQYWTVCAVRGDMAVGDGAEGAFFFSHLIDSCLGLLYFSVDNWGLGGAGYTTISFISAYQRT